MFSQSFSFTVTDTQLAACYFLTLLWDLLTEPEYSSNHLWKILLSKLLLYASHLKNWIFRLKAKCFLIAELYHI